MARILVPLPARDFDPTEVGVSCAVLTVMGHSCVFATPPGAPAAADPLMLTGQGLDPWGFIPLLRRLPLLGLALRADPRGRAAYQNLLSMPAFQHPVSWDQAAAAGCDALLLPGGHRAAGMRAYLESPVLQALTVQFFA